MIGFACHIECGAGGALRGLRSARGWIRKRSRRPDGLAESCYPSSTEVDRANDSVAGVLDERPLHRLPTLSSQCLRRPDRPDTIRLPHATAGGLTSRDDRWGKRVLKHLVCDPPGLTTFEEHIARRRIYDGLPAVDAGGRTVEIRAYLGGARPQWGVP